MEVRQAVLESGDISVSMLNYGAITQDWRVPVGGRRLPVVLGYRDPARYLHDTTHMGTIAGRVANRTAGAEFRLNGVRYRLSRNDGRHHLHGGRRGLGRRLWQMERDGARRLRLCYLSPDGEEGYPGQVLFTVLVTLEGARLSYEMKAEPDRPTPVNLAQHSYYNLMGAGQIWGHSLRLAAAQYLPVDDENIPTGAVAPVEGPLDFRAPRRLTGACAAHRGLDLNMVFAPRHPPAHPPAQPPAQAPVQPVAQLRADNGLCLRMWSDQPGAQIYTAAHMGATAGGLDGQVYGAHSGLCIEPQQPPDALHRAQFGAILATPERPYRQHLVVEIKAEDGV